MKKQAVILAGGLGTRLRAVTGGKPKVLAEIGGKPVLGHLLDLCHAHDFNDVILLLGHEAKAVQDYVGDGSDFGVRVTAVVEDHPLGSAGAVLSVSDQLHDRFAVLYGDTMTDIDLNRMWNFACADNSDATVLVHPNDHPLDSDLVRVGSDGRINAFFRWDAASALPRNLVSAALYILRRDSLFGLGLEAGISGPLDFGRHVFPQMLKLGRTISAYRSVEYIKDMGTPERLASVNEDLRCGRVQPGQSGRLRPVIFLDRDGTINDERGGVIDPTDFKLLPGAGEAIRQFNKAGLATVVVTNQPFVSHGTLTEEQLENVHARMECELSEAHAFIDAIYYCPHHPDAGYAGERRDLKKICECRKPAGGMVTAAAADLHLDLSEAWMIGDQTADIELGQRLGLRAVLVRSGHGGCDGKFSACPDYTFTDLGETADFITRDYPRMRQWADENLTAIRAGKIILIGGEARSGKSTWATVIAESLKARGLAVTTLALDNWLIDGDQQAIGVRGRYDLGAAQDVVDRICATNADLEVTVPVYDRFARKRIGSQNTPVPAERVLIVEGVLALALEAPDANRLTVHIPEAVRKRRFEAYYRWRGMNSTCIQELWNARNEDETPEVSALSAGAVHLYPTRQ